MDERRNQWHLTILTLTGMLVFLLAVYYETVMSIVAKWWTSGTYAHGFLIVPISLWLIWQKRTVLTAQRPIFCKKGLLGILFFSLTWYVGHLVSVLIVQQFSLLCLLLSTVLTLIGWRSVQIILFPLGYLFFAIPFGHFLVSHLQDFTAWFTVKALNLTGIPVYTQGWQISTSQGEFEVAEACSGIRYLIASLALGSLYAYLTYHHYVKRVIFIAACVGVPLLANAVRAYTIVLIAHFSQMQYAVGIDHLIYGWLFFGCIMGLLFWFGQKFREDFPTELDVDAPEPLEGMTSRPTSFISVSIAMVFLLSVVPLGAAVQEKFLKFPHYSLEESVSLPRLNQTWHGPLLDQGRWNPHYLGASQRILGGYTDQNGHYVELFMALYWGHTQDAELISSSHFPYDPKAWHVVRKDWLTIADRFKAQMLFVNNEGREELILYWYQVGESLSANPMWVKLMEAKYRIFLNTVPGKVVAIRVPVKTTSEEAKNTALNFLQEVYPLM